MWSILCLFLPHRRLGRSVWERDNVLRAVCRRCGAPLIKKDQYMWVRDTDPVPGPEPQHGHEAVARG